MLRGHFDALLSPEHSLALAGRTPIFFIHSEADKVVSPEQTKDLVSVYPGPKTAWYPEKGDHAAVWDANGAEYEQKVGAFLNRTQ